jgi:hypothetical protein
MRKVLQTVRKLSGHGNIDREEREARAVVFSVGDVAFAVISIGFVRSTGAKSIDTSIGRHLAQTVCCACHQTDASSPTPGPNPNPPSFVDISRMPSMSDVAIKVFLRSSPRTMPNIISLNLMSFCQPCGRYVRVENSTIWLGDGDF